MQDNKESLIGMDLAQLTEVVKGGGMPGFVAKQIAQWIYEKRATDFSEMVNISKRNREWLEENYRIGRRKPVKSVESTDGTVKYLFDADGRTIESVYIPDKDRATLCVSSQKGCRMNCYFCATGKGGYHGNLTCAQIINQILEIPPKGSGMQELTNVVFMGMGEPLDNFHEVEKAINILTSPWGFAWSPKRITVSTVGKLPELKDLLDRTQVHLAVSVHTAVPHERESMMPAERAFSLSSVIHLLHGYDFAHQRRLSFEYIMWRNVNDDIAHAEALAKLIGRLPVRVNLIRFHKIPGVELHPSSEEKMLIFRNYLNSKGILCTIRASRGEDIAAACGMLAGKRENC